jgi:ABC-type transport system substrate-binding protein
MYGVMHRKGSVARLAGALSVLALGCAPASGVLPSSTTTTAGTTATTTTLPSEPHGGEAVVGLGAWGAPHTLNPLLDGADTALLDVIAPATFATGYTIDPETLDPIPNVLAQIPSVDNGGLVPAPNGRMDVTVRVAPKAVWADGRPITADDLQFTYELVVDETLPIRSDLRERYGLIVPGTMRASGDQLTFRMQTSLQAELLFDIIVPRHQVAGSDFTRDWNEVLWVAGGPFSFAGYQPGQYLELVRNERYWKADPVTGEALPHLDRLVVRFFDPAGGSDPRLLETFGQRVLDVAVVAVPASDRTAYEELGPDAELQTAPALVWDHINFQFGPGNRNAASLNRYPEFRKAVAHAIDRNALADERGTRPLSSMLRLYVPSLSGDPWSEYTFDFDEVDRYLFLLGEELGVDLFAGDGPRMVITTSSESPATVALAGRVAVMLDAAGIGAELQLEDAALFFGETLDNGTWDVAAWRFTGGPGRARAIALTQMFDPEGLPRVGTNFFRWGTVDSQVSGEATERFAVLADELRATVDHDEIDRLLAEAESILAGEMVLLPLIVHDLEGAAVWTDEIEGVVVNPGQGALWNVETWRRVDA